MRREWEGIVLQDERLKLTRVRMKRRRRDEERDAERAMTDGESRVSGNTEKREI